MQDSVHSRDALIPVAANGQVAFDLWRSSGDYLPEFMRDFHDQKDLFKALQDVVERANAKHGGHRSLNAAWSEYHVYTVDIFLWVLAAHGYTLQRSRRKFGFRSVYDFISEANKRAREASISVLKQAFAPATGNLSPDSVGIANGDEPKTLRAKDSSQ